MNLWKILSFATHGLMTIFNKCSKFQNDPINILGDMTFFLVISYWNIIFLYQLGYDFKTAYLLEYWLDRSEIWYTY